MSKSKYICPKCENKAYQVGTVRMTGSFMHKLFNIQNRKFTTVTCTKCKYTEFFETSSSQLGNILDFFTN